MLLSIEYLNVIGDSIDKAMMYNVYLNVIGDSIDNAGLYSTCMSIHSFGLLKVKVNAESPNS